MINYLIEVQICWLLCFVLYQLVFSRLTFFQSNRAYLLGSIGLGLLLPWLELNPIVNAEPVNIVLETITVSVNSINETANATTESFSFLQLLYSLYLIGCLIFGLRFFYGLYQIFKIYSTSKKENKGAYYLIKTQNIHLPFSFFHCLFWSDKINFNKEETENILKHELAHIRQGHSFDVIFLEILTILFWWSPFIFLYKKTIKAIHEFLADADVLQKSEIKTYGNLLVKQSQSGRQLVFANHFVQSQLKSRIVMMTKSKSTKVSRLSYALILPLCSVLLLLFSCNRAEPVNAIDDKVNTITENQDRSKLDKETTTLDSKIEIENAKKETDTANPNTENPVENEFLQSDENDVFKVVEEMPRFPGCEEMIDIDERKGCSQKRMLEFIYKNISYPAEARENGIQGTAVVRFVVDKDGKVVDPKIVRDIGGSTGEEVLRIIEKMKEEVTWIPGKQKGKAVKVYFNLPVKFRLE